MQPGNISQSLNPFKNQVYFHWDGVACYPGQQYVLIPLRIRSISTASVLEEYISRVVVLIPLRIRSISTTRIAPQKNSDSEES